jgi:tetratricopeptide (TPR) repeat protein
MKSKFIYAGALFVFTALVIFIIWKYYSDEKKKNTAFYEVLQRKGAAAQSVEWASVKSQADVLINAVKVNPSDIKSSLNLAAIYIREARITGNYMYYDVAAMKCINHVLKQDSLNFNALIYKALIQLSQHHFAEALVTAEKAKKINPHNAFVYGILVDGFVEMGDYKAAVENSDKMVSIRPDLSSYSRISYLREIHGDIPGAIDAMKMAVSAGAPGDETTEWSRVQLAHLYEHIGELRYAEMHYTIATDERPNYPYALAGFGRIAMAEKNYHKAIGYLKRADSVINDYAIRNELSEAYSLAGQESVSAAINKNIIKEMSKYAGREDNREETGHYSDRELAYAYLKVNDYDKALMHALTEYRRRPENIDVNETVGWVYYKKGDYSNALPHMQKALRTGCKTPVLLCHAGLVFAKAGETKLSRTILTEVTRSKALIPQSLKTECLTTLQHLN